MITQQHLIVNKFFLSGMKNIFGRAEIGGEKMSIKSARKAKGISQRKLAELVGVQQGAVARWELGKAFPRFEKLAVIANSLDCTIDDLVREDSE